MVRTLLKVCLAGLAGLLALVGGLVVGVRVKYPPVLGFVRRVLRDRANPQALGVAGAPGESNGVIVHTGRRSGSTFRTPVTPMPVADGYLIALPYGPGSDWVRNVLAAGSATLVTDGEEVAVDRPQIEPIRSYEHLFAPGGRLGMRLFGVTECLVLRRVPRSSGSR